MDSNLASGSVDLARELVQGVSIARNQRNTISLLSEKATSCNRSMLVPNASTSFGDM